MRSTGLDLVRVPSAVEAAPLAPALSPPCRGRGLAAACIEHASRLAVPDATSLEPFFSIIVPIRPGGSAPAACGCLGNPAVPARAFGVLVARGSSPSAQRNAAEQIDQVARNFGLPRTLNLW